MNRKPSRMEAWIRLTLILAMLSALCLADAAQDNTAEGWYKKGNDLLNKSAWNDAIEAYDKALQIDPTYANAWSNKAVALDMLGKHEEAIQAFDRAIQECNKTIQANPRDVNAWVNKGNALKFRTNTMLRIDSIKQDRPKYLEEAVNAYNKALEIDPGNTEALMQKGSVLDLLGRHEDALGSYNKAIEANPQDAESWLLKGNALSQMGKYEEALSCYDKVLDLDPKNPYVSESRGLALVGLGYQKEAAKSYSKALEPYDKAIKTASSTKELSEAWLGKGFVLQEQDKYEEAVNALDNATNADPKNEMAWKVKGVLLWRELKRYNDAIEAFDRALQINPKDPLTWLNKGNALKALGRQAEADAAYAKAKELGYQGGPYSIFLTRRIK